ncbi:MAG: ABC transporter substrate-binding protein [Pseudomonadales bacterium]|nr:ABC transporter substrate-binding protein [Pseudomonadales bacterium]
MTNSSLVLFVCLLLQSAAIAAIEITDDEGSLIRLDSPAERIISLAPSLTELVFAAGAGNKLVGVVEYSDFPPEANALPIVGRFDLLDMERILQLQPDLVIAWQSGNPRASVARLKQLGLTVYIAEPKTLDTIPDHIEKLGILAGTQAVAAAAVNQFDTHYQELRTEFSDKAAVKIFYQVWDVPLITSGGNELINDIISLCGGENIFAELQLIAPKVSEEAVLVRNPEVIIASGMDIERPEWLDDWKQWPGLAAVEKGNLFFVPPELLQRHTPRALLGAQQMCGQIDRARQSL